MKRNSIVAFAALMSLGGVASAKTLVTPAPMALRQTVPTEATTNSTPASVQVPGFDIQPTPEQRRAQHRHQTANTSGSTIPPPP